MSFQRTRELSSGLHQYDGWRLRSLTEEAANETVADIDEHAKALKNVRLRLEKDDLSGAAEGLKIIQAAIGRTAAALMPVEEEYSGLDKQLVALSDLATRHGLYEADEWVRQMLAEKNTPLGTLAMVKHHDAERRAKSRNASRKRRGVGQFASK